MIDLDWRPRLARDVLRRYAAERVEAGLRVAWVSADGARRSAVRRENKSPGYWLVSSDHWEQYYPKRWVLEELATARAVEVIDE